MPSVSALISIANRLFNKTYSIWVSERFFARINCVPAVISPDESLPSEQASFSDPP